jgi:hypothetical protein
MLFKQESLVSIPFKTGNISKLSGLINYLKYVIIGKSQSPLKRGISQNI